MARAFLVLALLASSPAAAITILDVDFEGGEAGFVYVDDPFRGTDEPDYAAGALLTRSGNGVLSVTLGGVDNQDVNEMSGGWWRQFSLMSSAELEITFRYRISQTGQYEDDEYSQVMLSVDGVAVGTGGSDFVVEIEGDDNDVSSEDRTTGWRQFRLDLGNLTSGSHSITIGGHNNHKDRSNEFTEILIDDVRIATPAPVPVNLSADAIVSSLEMSRFKERIADLVEFGTRHWNEQGNLDAIDWLAGELASYGYANVERHQYTYESVQRESIYATKIGTLYPDRMYIVSAHVDSRSTPIESSGFAPGADDDASGCALVLEAARVFAPYTVETDVSVRFVFWNNEETYLDGSKAYVADRRALQGVEEPPGSGQYPEPTWLGIIQHDMILYDHGLPPQSQQIPEADIDLEYRSAALFVGDSVDLATAVYNASTAHASNYPAEVSARMHHTDSRSFQEDCAAISVRENRRVAEIGEGSNPHWHQNSDVMTTYSDADFLLGFNAVQTTVGAVAALAGARVIVCGDGIVPPSEACDDGDLEPGDGCDDACSVEADWTCAGEPSMCAVCRPTDLRFPDPATTTTLAWHPPDPSVCPALFDLARSDLAALRSTGDLSTATCLAEDVVGSEIRDLDTPSPGTGFGYLVRTDGDSWENLTVPGGSSRDATLDACP